MNTYYNLRIHLEVPYTHNDVVVLSTLLSMPYSNAVGLLRRLSTTNVLSVYAPLCNIEFTVITDRPNNLKCLYSKKCDQKGEISMKLFINRVHRLYKTRGISKDKYYVQNGVVFFAIC